MSGQAASNTSGRFVCCTPERFVSDYMDRFCQEDHHFRQRKQVFIYVVYAVYPASQLSLLMSTRKSSRLQHISAPVLQNELGNCTMAAKNAFALPNTWLNPVNKSILRRHLTVESNKHVAVVSQNVRDWNGPSKII